MNEIICTTDILREKGFIYFTGTDEKGNLTIMRSPTAPSKRKKEVSQ
jgi:hypothetical protein